MIETCMISSCILCWCFFWWINTRFKHETRARILVEWQTDQARSAIGEWCATAARVSDCIMPLIVRIQFARYIYSDDRIRWLIADGSVNVNSGAYELYVSTQYINHKHQVPYMRQSKFFDKITWQVTKNMLGEDPAKEVVFKYSDDEYDSCFWPRWRWC